jgi:HEPN domain-containing protein
MQDSRAHARGWFLKAESDLTAARRLLDTEGPYDTVCFHAQQAVEKLLKYDFEFWPDSETASDALHLALKVRQAIVAALPSQARP